MASILNILKAFLCQMHMTNLRKQTQFTYQLMTISLCKVLLTIIKRLCWLLILGTLGSLFFTIIITFFMSMNYDTCYQCGRLTSIHVGANCNRSLFVKILSVQNYFVQKESTCELFFFLCFFWPEVYKGQLVSQIVTWFVADH